MWRRGRWLISPAIVLAMLFAGCGRDDNRDAEQRRTSLSVPVPAEAVTITAQVRRALGPHAVELGDAPTLVIVLDGLPPSLRAGDEVRATGSVEVFDEDLGGELGVPLHGSELRRFHGVECLVVGRPVVLND